MFRQEVGRVIAILERESTYALIRVWVDGRDDPDRAIAYPTLTGMPEVGDRVLLNTTAVQLGLGTGGTHFVTAVVGKPYPSPSTKLSGHIMKLRYTPWQFPVLAGEEDRHSQSIVYRKTENRGLEGLPVVVCELHSHLRPVVWMLRTILPPQARVVYLMTDGAALPAWLSRQIGDLRKRGWLQAVVTAGHAFGGDHEAVTLASGLLVAKSLGDADVAVVAMGPGIVGTGTRYGHTALETAFALQSAAQLGGRPIACLRMSSGDARERHLGISHHTLTALAEFCLVPCWVPLPMLEEPWRSVLDEQLTSAGLPQRHHVVEVDCRKAFMRFLCEEGSQNRTMGRNPTEDELYYMAALSAGIFAAHEFYGNRT